MSYPEPGNAGLVRVPCPNCGTTLPIPVHARIDGRADDGTIQVSILPDKTEVWAHSLTHNEETR